MYGTVTVQNDDGFQCDALKLIKLNDKNMMDFSVMHSLLKLYFQMTTL